MEYGNQLAALRRWTGTNNVQSPAKADKASLLKSGVFLKIVGLRSKQGARAVSRFLPTNEVFRRTANLRRKRDAEADNRAPSFSIEKTNPKTKQNESGNAVFRLPELRDRQCVL
jgi:hypothetical protein